MHRIFSSLLLLVLISHAAEAQKQSEGLADFQASVHLFDYDSKQPLDVQDKVIQETSAFTIHDLTYASPKGGRVPEYFVVPKGKGPFAAVLFGHYGLGTRSEFIPEAKLYAKAGAISLIPDYPWDRPEPWHKTVSHFDKPELDNQAYMQAVVDLRRGIDLLLARTDVDPTRLAYVGHSYGAQWGSILSGVDKRMKATVLMAGVAETADIFLRNQDPDLADLRKNQPPGQLEKYVQVTSELDALRFVGHAAPVTLLLQFANFERYFDKTSEQHYVETASEPKKVLWYDTGHELNDPQALRDRYEWLTTQIRLKPGVRP